MEYWIGLALAALTCVSARIVGFDRDRVFYPAMAVVVASYYILFAAMANSTRALILESLFAGAFLVLAGVGFRTNLWLVVTAIAGHGIFDSLHHLLIRNPGVPAWWPGFCLSFDILAGAFLAAALLINRCRTPEMPESPGHLRSAICRSAQQRPLSL